MKKNFAILVDVSKCSGCRACQVACKKWNNLPAEKTSQTGTYQNPTGLSSITWNIVLFKEDFLEKGRPKWFFRMHKCMHCANPKCIQSCPSQAIYKDRQTGAVIINQKKCRGSGNCASKCPWYIPKLDHKTGKAFKCTFCIDRIQNKMEPACVKICPTNALQFGRKYDIYKMADKRLKELKSTYTQARVYGTDKKTSFGELGTVYVLPERLSYYSL